MSSNAVGSEFVSRVLGYDLEKGNFQTTGPNLPQRVVILGEANHANQTDLDTDETQILSAKQAGDLYGYGSPIHICMRIIRSLYGGDIGGIPTVVLVQEEAVGAASKVITVTPSGTATGNGTHYVKVAGRNQIDAEVYAINVEEGDNVADITGKIEDAINGVLGSPMSATSTDYLATLTSKWRGLTANDLQVEVDTNDDDLGLSYAVASSQAGAGTPSIATALAAFGNKWNTIVINSYGTVETIMDALEAFNGRPLVPSPTGRYKGIVFKPFLALTGSVADDPSSITDGREEDVTIVICPAPLSKGLPMEAAANACLIFARKMQDTPHLDVCGESYPDMPTPTDIGSMSDYTSRDAIVKKGCSTVDLIAGAYQIQDFVTTYHPTGENPPQYRFARNLNLDWNVRYGYYLLEQRYVVDKTLADDDAVITVDEVIKPKQWKGILLEYADDLEKRALSASSEFMSDSLEANISSVNPDRFETEFSYKRTGIARILATSAKAGFNYGSST